MIDPDYFTRTEKVHETTSVTTSSNSTFYAGTIAANKKDGYSSASSKGRVFNRVISDEGGNDSTNCT